MSVDEVWSVRRKMIRFWALVLLLSSFFFHAENLNTRGGHSSDLQRVEGPLSFWGKTANAAALVRPNVENFVFENMSTLDF